jgi:hypothetical protein
MENPAENMASRLDEIEKTIGDIAQVLYSLKQALMIIPEPPNCPPYCGHHIVDEYVDPLSTEDRVKDIRKCIGDTGVVFRGLIDALEGMSPISCPPYCGHN